MATRRGPRNLLRKALFVQLYFDLREDRTLASIMREAGYCKGANDATATKEAQRMLADPWVKQQVAERQRRAMRRMDYGAEKSVGRLVEIASARAHEYAELLASSDPYSVLRTMDPALAGAIEAIQVERHPDGSHKKTSLKFYSAIDANIKLGTMWGLRFQQDKVIALGEPADDVTERTRKIADLLSDMDAERYAVVKQALEYLRAAEQRRLTHTLDGEIEEVAEDGEETREQAQAQEGKTEEQDPPGDAPAER